MSNIIDCSFCDEKAFSKGNFNFHLTSVHFKDKEYQCRKCHFKTATKGAFTRHVNVNHLRQEDEKKCISCPYKTPSLLGLNSHLKSVHHLDIATAFAVPSNVTKSKVNFKNRNNGKCPKKDLRMINRGIAEDLRSSSSTTTLSRESSFSSEIPNSIQSRNTTDSINSLDEVRHLARSTHSSNLEAITRRLAQANPSQVPHQSLISGSDTRRLHTTGIQDSRTLHPAATGNFAPPTNLEALSRRLSENTKATANSLHSQFPLPAMSEDDVLRLYWARLNFYRDCNTLNSLTRSAAVQEQSEPLSLRRNSGENSSSSISTNNQISPSTSPVPPPPAMAIAAAAAASRFFSIPESRDSPNKAQHLPELLSQYTLLMNSMTNQQLNLSTRVSDGDETSYRCHFCDFVTHKKDNYEDHLKMRHLNHLVDKEPTEGVVVID